MKKLTILLLLLCLLAGCGAPAEAAFSRISAEEAKQMMDAQPEAVVLDVREQDEYDAGHIPGAVLLPVGTISAESAAGVIPAKDTAVLVYCRSGNRSKTASQKLAELGYTAIYEFGGIRDWPHEIEVSPLPGEVNP